MTPHQKALIWLVVAYLFALDQIGVIAHSPFLMLVYFVLLPVGTYTIARAVMVAWRVRVIVLPHEEFTPRCPECESKGLAYTIERVSSTVTEKWNTLHEHSVQVKNSRSMECNRGHFVQFRVRPKTIVKRYRRRNMADYLRALRRGFHNMHFSEDAN